jgi:hypothetical protein
MTVGYEIDPNHPYGEDKNAGIDYAPWNPHYPTDQQWLVDPWSGTLTANPSYSGNSYAAPGTNPGNGISKDLYSFQAGAQMPQGQSQVTPEVAAYLNALASQSSSSSNSGGGGGGGGSSSMDSLIKAAIDKINEDHARQVAAIGLNRDQGLQGIANAFSTFQQGTGANNAQYNTASDSINRAIADRLAQAMAQQQSASTAQANQASQLGWNGAAIQANAENNNNALQNALRYQQDLADRYRQVQSNSQGATANAGQLMNQGAQGQLANNYNSAVNSADAAASDATYKAQHPTVNVVSGGSSKSSTPSNSADLWASMGVTPAELGAQYALFSQDSTSYSQDPNNSKYMPAVSTMYYLNHGGKL